MNSTSSSHDRAHRRRRRERRTTRRLGALVVTGAVVVAACGGDDAGGSDELDPDADLSQQSLVISNWDEYTPDTLIPSFIDEFGTSVDLTLHASNEEIVAKLIQSGGEGYDIAFVSSQFAQQLDEAGLLAQLDHDLIPNIDKLDAEARELASDPGLAFSVPYTWGTTGLCYREDLVPAAPTSWNDLLDPDPELSGRITMLQTDRWMVLPAQKALGFSLNTTDADEMAQVEELLISAKRNLLAFDDTTFYSRLVSGEAAMVQAWDGWCNYAIWENDDVRFVVPSEGSDLWADSMVVLASSSNKEAAHAFINWVLEPENHKDVAELVLYKVPSAEAMALVDPEYLELFPNMAMTAEELLAGESLVDLGESTSLYTDVVTRVIAS